MRKETTTVRVDEQTREWLHLLADSRKMSITQYLHEVSCNARLDMPAPVSAIEVWLSHIETNLSAISLELMTLKHCIREFKESGAEYLTLPHEASQRMLQDGRENA